jgi:hypothetical protein
MVGGKRGHGHAFLLVIVDIGGPAEWSVLGLSGAVYQAGCQGSGGSRWREIGEHTPKIMGRDIGFIAGAAYIVDVTPST